MVEVASFTYKNDDGFAFFITEAPASAKTKADVIAMATVKKASDGSLLQSEIAYVTPDEAMAIAQGLLACVDAVMAEKFREFRREKDATP
jgi:hypothetical protein